MKKIKVMIVDDEDTFLSATKRGLEAFGDIEVLAVNDPQVAAANLFDRDQWRDGYPEMFLLDIVMPTMMGFRLAEIIREHEDLKTVPIVYFTASERFLTRDELKRRGWKFNKSDCFVKGDFELEKLRMEILKRAGRLKKL